MQQIWDESIARGEREVEQATAYRKKIEAQNSTTKVRPEKRAFDCTEEDAERNPNKRHQQAPPPPPTLPSPSLSSVSQTDNHEGPNHQEKKCNHNANYYFRKLLQHPEAS